MGPRPILRSLTLTPSTRVLLPSSGYKLPCYRESTRSLCAASWREPGRLRPSRLRRWSNRATTSIGGRCHPRVRRSTIASGRSAHPIAARPSPDTSRTPQRRCPCPAQHPPIPWRQRSAEPSASPCAPPRFPPRNSASPATSGRSSRRTASAATARQANVLFNTHLKYLMTTITRIQ